MSVTTLRCFTGVFELHRRPHVPRLPLQAWDAADEYLLETIASQPSLGRMLVLNDAFGALAVALHAARPDSWGDSFTARMALQENLQRNHLLDSVTFIPSTMPLAVSDDTGQLYDTVLWRIPKSLALWQQQLAYLSPAVKTSTLVLAGGMVKHLPAQSKEMLAQLGMVEVYPAVKKARLFRVTPGAGLPPPAMPDEKALSLPEYGLQLMTGPNVFAREKLDAGAQFFLDQFPALPEAARIADLGCGNGVLGLAVKRRQPGAALHFFDESYQAIAAAEANYAQSGFRDIDPEAQFSVDDCLSHYGGPAFDLILCNPPFHQAHVVSDQTAWEMFVQSRRHLRSGGELWIVGNRHLNYHVKLKRIFGNYRQIAAHPQFVVLAARK